MISWNTFFVCACFNFVWLVGLRIFLTKLFYKKIYYLDYSVGKRKRPTIKEFTVFKMPSPSPTAPEDRGQEELAGLKCCSLRK